MTVLVVSLPLMAQEKASLAVELYAKPSKQEVRVANGTGAIFVRDFSHPKFGTAFRDVNGMIWSDLLKDEKGQIKFVNNLLDGHRACREAGGRLPVKSEFTAMLQSIGLQTDKFSALTRDGLEVIESFDSASTILGDSPKNIYGFDYLVTFRPKETVRNLGAFAFREVRVIDNQEKWAVRCVATAEPTR